MNVNQRVYYLVLTSWLTTILSGCGVVRGVARRAARACEEDTYVVTKTDDDFDGICTREDCSLREAISTANDCEGLQTIVLGRGTYDLSRPNEMGEENHDVGVGALNIIESVTIRGETPAETIVHASPELNDRVFQVDYHPRRFDVAPDVIRISNLTIERGATDGFGGGIEFLGENLILENVVLRDNRAAGGAGFYASGDVTLRNVQLLNNQGGQGNVCGGGAWISGEATIVNGLFRGNRMPHNELSRTGAGPGGGVCIQGQLDMIGTVVEGNFTHSVGGGIWIDIGPARLEDVVLRENSAENGGGIGTGAPAGVELENVTIEANEATPYQRRFAAGGGIMIFEGPVELNKVTLSGNLVLGRSGAGHGGAIYVGSSGEIHLTNSTISGNEAGGNGGGIWNGGLARIDFSTFAFNRARGGAGIFAEGPTFIQQSIIAEHGGGLNCIVFSPGRSLSMGNNIADDSSCLLTGPGDLEVDNVLLHSALVIHPPGTTATHALEPDSPARDRLFPSSCVATDQRGVSRPQGSRCDLGAFELEVREALSLEGTAEPSRTPTELPSTPPTVVEDTLCWKGPGAKYETVSSLQAGAEVELLGRGESEGWWVIDNPRYPGVPCWTPEEDLDVNPQALPPDMEVFPVPPLPTPTSTPILGCLYQDQNQPVCYPIENCPVDFEDSLGSCTP
jgi:CSLREA domain-containing protein